MHMQISRLGHRAFSLKLVCVKQVLKKLPKGSFSVCVAFKLAKGRNRKKRAGIFISELEKGGL